MKNEMIMKVYTPYDKSFNDMCDYLESNICKENLAQNGGILNYNGLTYNSDFLIVAFDKKKPVGYNSVIITNTNFYIYQIAVKNEYKQRGIGTSMMKAAIKIATDANQNVTANVRDYNIASQRMVEKLGFEKVSDNNGNYLYLLEQKELNKKH